jgi:phosphotriesterase-related protein
MSDEAAEACAHNGDVGVRVRTVLGDVSVTDLGVTLMHEHTLRTPPPQTSAGVRQFSPSLRDAPVTARNAWQVREDPYASLDNRALTSVEQIADEIAVFRDAGGRTIVDNSNGAERAPELAVQVAEATGIQLVMGSTPAIYSGAGIEDLELVADALEREHRDGVPLRDGRRVRPGVIGEVQVSPNFTDSERLDLLAASIAQPRIGAPLMIHLPGWLRRGHEVLDLVLGAGVDPAAVVLCHMDPSGTDAAYQREIAARGVWLEFDMIGMMEHYPGEGQSPAVQDTVTAVAGLVRDGFSSQLLLSQDVGLKTMWTRNGGNGYGYIQGVFLPRLAEAGIEQDVLARFLTENPRSLFTAAHESTR